MALLDTALSGMSGLDAPAFLLGDGRARCSGFPQLVFLVPSPAIQMAAGRAFTRSARALRGNQ